MSKNTNTTNTNKNTNTNKQEKVTLAMVKKAAENFKVSSYELGRRSAIYMENTKMSLRDLSLQCEFSKTTLGDVSKCYRLCRKVSILEWAKDNFRYSSLLKAFKEYGIDEKATTYVFEFEEFKKIFENIGKKESLGNEDKKADTKDTTTNTTENTDNGKDTTDTSKDKNESVPNNCLILNGIVYPLTLEQVATVRKALNIYPTVGNKANK